MDPGGLQNLTIHFLEKMKYHLKDDPIQALVKEDDFAETILRTA